MDNTKYTICIDSREQKPWVFPDIETVTTKLATGDYTLEGFGQEICIERKGNIGEFAMNITEKRFDDVVKRLNEFKHGYLLLEFNMYHLMAFPQSSAIPRSKWPYIKITPNFLLKRLLDYQLNYNFKTMLVGEYGQHVCKRIFDRFVASRNTR
jgi:ERCC4-type nuclease